jgi:hypothetical protein
MSASAPGPPRMAGGPGKAPASFARNDRSVWPKKTVTVTGAEAIPLATTTSVLVPGGVPGGSVNLVAEGPFVLI